MNKTANAEAEATLPLRDFATAEKASELKDAILKRRGGDLSIDGVDVEFLSGLALEALVSARATWRLDGASMTILNPSEQMKRDVELLGMAALLTCGGDGPPDPKPSLEGEGS